jgi:lipid II:glycine glycyltransferase (peptidoglycan interpeptide bridge formation enzyme)
VAAAAAALGERCVVWSVLRDGVPVAVNVVLTGANHAVGWMCAMDTTGLARETLATYLLHSLAIRDACEHGIRWFHMGESDAGSGPEHFKRYFGAVPVSYAALRFERLPLSRAEHAARTALGAVSTLRRSS